MFTEGGGASPVSPVHLQDDLPWTPVPDWLGRTLSPRSDYLSSIQQKSYQTFIYQNKISLQHVSMSEEHGTTQDAGMRDEMTTTCVVANFSVGGVVHSPCPGCWRWPAVQARTRRGNPGNLPRRPSWNLWDTVKVVRRLRNNRRKAMPAWRFPVGALITDRSWLPTEADYRCSNASFSLHFFFRFSCPSGKDLRASRQFNHHYAFIPRWDVGIITTNTSPSSAPPPPNYKQVNKRRAVAVWVCMQRDSSPMKYIWIDEI